MSTPPPSIGNGLRIASFDGGGLRAFSQLKMMQLFMHRLRSLESYTGTRKAFLPCHYFHMIGGSDTGGLIAIMLVKLKMSVEDAIVEFATIVKEVYAVGLGPENRTSRLRECMESLLMRRGLPSNLKLEDEPHDRSCVGFVVTALRLNVRTKVCLRTYPVQSDLPSDITVIDAALATCALQPEFLPLPYGAWYERQEYVGAGLGANNPVRQVLAEAHSYFTEDSGISTLLSLGSGHPGVLSLQSDDDDTGLYRLMREMMQDAEQEAQEFQHQISEVGSYFRFSVEHGLQRTYSSAKGLDWVTIQTKSYLEQPMTTATLDRLVKSLSEGVGMIPLTQAEARVTGMNRDLGQTEVQRPEIRVPAIGWHPEISNTAISTHLQNPKVMPLNRQIEAKAEIPILQVRARQSEGEFLQTSSRRTKLAGGSPKSHHVQSLKNYLGIPRWGVHAS